ncbi:hypothetical protein QFC20_005647 [Naganishia adeliensis]|uniref:Uncharacterized protein n=1 Tax=Naganishia adeliensis TaxID=92952 RepID=A0ACC2VLT6_9TREE|nr:hypothetical protein QFC20_005647 [Naganishia adeliensis]
MHSKTPFLMHFLLAIPATINFYFLSRPPKAQPSAPETTSNEASQLAQPTASHSLPDAQVGAVIRNYSFSLLSSCLTALTVYRWIDRPAETFSHGLGASIYNDLAASLAVYHVGPILRALGRVFGRSAGTGGDRLGKDLGGPVLHLVVHVVVMGALIMEALR